MKSRLIFIAGPTASGKTDVAIALAGRLKGEIISCDSMQIYKGMDILTSKPSPALRKKIPHHMMDFLPVSKDYNVSEFRKAALKKAQGILKRKKTPIFAGGTGLYMNVLIDGIFEVKTEDNKVRENLYREAESAGSAALHKKLAKVDPEAAGKIHPNDARRIVRALEVYKVTGKPISSLHKLRKGLGEDYDVRMFCLDPGREVLYNRINRRVERMFRQGLVAEVKKILKRKPGRTALAAIGIREIKDHLDGLTSLSQAKESIKRNTRNYSRRQMTWFRKNKQAEWIPVGAGDTVCAVSKKIEKRLG
jgi:tRNA dimethylallyltransferase